MKLFKESNDSIALSMLEKIHHKDSDERHKLEGIARDATSSAYVGEPYTCTRKSSIHGFDLTLPPAAAVDTVSII